MHPVTLSPALVLLGALATPILPTPALATSILYRVDSTIGVDQFAAALSALPGSYSVTTTRASLAGYTLGNYNIVVYANQNDSIPSGDLAALNAYIAAGGKVIFQDWVTADNTSALNGAFSGTRNQTRVTVSGALATGITNPIQLSSPGWSTFSTGLTVLSGGVIDALFGNGDAAIIAGNSGSTFFNGFLIDTAGAQGETLYLNEIFALSAALHNIDSTQAYFAASGLGTIVNPAFRGGVLGLDQAGATIPQPFTLDGSATNTIDQNGNTATFSGVFSDATAGVPGNITIANSGTGGAAIFDAANTYTGFTAITPGATLTLTANGSIASSSAVYVDGTLNAPTLTINGLLRGSGLVNAPTTVTGTLAPGDSPGTLNFSAPLTLGSGATTEIDIDGTATGSGAGSYSRIVSSSSVTVAGTLQPLLRGIEGNASNSYVPAIGQLFPVILASGGVLGSFSAMGTTDGLPAGTRFDAIYAPTSLTLAVTPTAYGNLGAAGLVESPNATAVGALLDTVRPAPGMRASDAAGSLFYPLYALPGSAISPALEQLAPAIYGEGLLAARDAWADAADVVSSQIAGRRNGATAGTDTVQTPDGYTLWATALGRGTQVDGSGGAGYHSSVAGMMLGADFSPIPGAILGFAAGGSRVAASGNGASLDGPAAHFALYGGYQAGRFFLDGQASFLHADESATRNLSAWGQSVKGSRGVDGGGAQVNAGLTFITQDWTLEPFVGAAVSSFSGDALTETGNAPFTEGVGGASVTSVRSRAGLRVGTTFLATPTLPVHVHALLGWDHEFANNRAQEAALFAALGSGAFEVVTPHIGRDSARLGGGVSADVSPAISVYADYGAALATHATSHAITGGLRVRF